MSEEIQQSYEINPLVAPKGTKCNCGHSVEVHGTNGKICGACPCKVFVEPPYQEPTVPPDRGNILRCPECKQPVRPQHWEDESTGDIIWSDLLDCENVECSRSQLFFGTKKPMETRIS